MTNSCFSHFAAGRAPGNALCGRSSKMAPFDTQNFIHRIEIGSYIKEIIRGKLN